MNKESPKNIIQICSDIWELTQNRLAARFPFLRGMLLDFSFQPQYEESLPGTDGETIFYPPAYVIKAFQRDPENLEYTLLHMLFHCLYLHPFQNADGAGSDWQENCDITVARMLARAGFPAAEVQTSPHPSGPALARAGFPAADAQTSPHPSGPVLARACDFSSADAQALLHADSHAFWRGSGTAARLAQIENTWKAIGQNHGFGISGAAGSVGSSAGKESEPLSVQEVQHRRFRRYLKRFAVPQEEMHTDTESFDYIPYMYGLQRYQNMPLIEHLEYRECRRLRELVIAIDTSASCTADTIRKFLEETYDILSDEENFSGKMNVYLLQCDCEVQSAVHIGCEKEWRDYLQTLSIHGRGGTDFRPVFSYVEKLRSQKLLKDLKGLLYFTDGDGIYPTKQTDYETAFIFLDEKENHQQVPGWAATFRLT